MNLSSLKPAVGSTKVRKRGWSWCRFWFRWYFCSWSQRCSNHVQVTLVNLVLKVVKCLFNVVFLNSAFKNINRVEYKAINLDTIQALVDTTGVTVITHDVLYQNGLVSKNDLVKILSRGEIKSAVEVQVKGFSASAKAAIEAAGGKAVVA